MYSIRRFSSLTSSTENKKENKSRKKSIGIVSGLVGADLLAGTDYDKITGLEHVYHSTSSPEQVMREGIKSKFAMDPNNVTNRVLPHVDSKEKEGLVYLGRRKAISDAVGVNRDNISNYYDSVPTKSKTLKLVIPYNDIKDRLTDNPELLGAKNSKEFMNKVNEIRPFPTNRLGAMLEYNMLGKEGTHTIKGDIASKYIVGYKDYNPGKYGLKEFKDYVVKNPGRFGKSAAKAATGTALVGGGVYLIGKDIKDKRSNKK